MPKGRMLNKKISFDEKVAELSLKSALFFTWCIPHLDVGGKILGDLNYLKGNVCPYRKDISVKDIEKSIVELAEKDLIVAYGDAHKYLYFKGFGKNQNLNPDKEAESIIPDPSPELLQSNSGETPGKVKGSISKDKEKGREGDSSSTPYSNLVDHWNSFAKEIGLSTIVTLSPKRKKSVINRLTEPEFKLDKIFDEIRQSEFLKGKNERGWKADFDFVFCSANNYLKIIEGKYRTNGTNRNQHRKGDLNIDKYKREIATEGNSEEEKA